MATHDRLAAEAAKDLRSEEDLRRSELSLGLELSVPMEYMEEVNQRLERAIKKNYSIIRDVARNRPQRTPLYDSRPYCVGKDVDMRTAAMVLALKRIEAHYLIEGFSQ